MTENIQEHIDLSPPFRGTGGLSDLIPHIESLVFASDKPLTTQEITDLINSAFGFMEEKVSVEQSEAVLEGIVEKYNSEFYPFEVRQSGGGWQFLTKKEYHKTVAQLNGEKFLKRLSSAALETLAIVAYKQPVTKGEIEAIRGVSSDYAIQKLLEKELVVITGRAEKMPGQPLIYATSKNFMDYFGINSAEDLPKIKEVLAAQIVTPTVIHHTDFGEALPTDAAEPDDTAEDVADEEPITENIFSTTDAPEDENLPPADNEPGVPQTETLADEVAQEEAIADEIFVMVDEAEQEEAVKLADPADETNAATPSANEEGIGGPQA